MIHWHPKQVQRKRQSRASKPSAKRPRKELIEEKRIAYEKSIRHLEQEIAEVKAQLKARDEQTGSRDIGLDEIRSVKISSLKSRSEK
jgi:hypothetical protein